MIDDEWSVVVFKCPPEQTKKHLIDFYRYVEYLVGVKSVHFLIRDRLDEEVVVSFRILLDPAEKTHVKEAIILQLQHSFPEGMFVLDPEPEHPLYPYVAWDWKDRVSKYSPEKLKTFYHSLAQLSRLMVDMAENDYFNFQERVEMVHLSCWMLGCAEYGLLSTREMKVGYYDHIEDKYHSHLTYAFKE